MKIVDIGDERYYVIKEIPNFNVELLEELTEAYKDKSHGTILLKSTNSDHHAIAIRIEDADYEEIIEN